MMFLTCFIKFIVRLSYGVRIRVDLEGWDNSYLNEMLNHCMGDEEKI
jgi:hypothetical protein